MGLFSMLTKPYSSMIKNISKSGEGIKKDIERVSDSINSGKQNKKNVRYMDADNSKAAFEMLFKENEWSEKELEQKAVWLRKARLIMMAFSWVSFMVALSFFAFFFKKNWFISSFFTFFFISSALLCLLNALRFSLYHEQVIQRDLITLKQFLKEGELIRKFFG